MTRILVGMLVSVIVLLPTSATSSDSGVERLDGNLWYILRQRLTRDVEGSLESLVDITSIDHETELVTYVFDGTTRRIQLGTNGLPTLDEYLAMSAGAFLTAELWEIPGPYTEKTYRQIFQRSVNEIGPARFRGFSFIPKPETVELADRIAIQSLVPDVALIEPTKNKKTGELRSLAQYRVLRPNGAPLLVHIQREMTPIDPQYVTPDGRPKSAGEFEDILLALLGTPATEQGAAPVCNAALVNNPWTGCHQTAVAIADENWSLMGSGVWIGGRYILTSNHIAKTQDWTGPIVFTGYDLADPTDADYAVALKYGPGGKTAVRVRHPATGEFTPLIVVRLAAPPEFLAETPPPATFLTNPDRASLRKTHFFGAGFGFTGRENDSAGMRRKGTMKAVCIPGAPALPETCKGDPVFAEDGIFFKLEHEVSRNGVLSWACDYDSGSPVFALANHAGEELLTLVGILEKSIDDSRTCAAQSYFVDVTQDWMQQGIRIAILELEGLPKDGTLPEGIFSRLDAIPVDSAEPSVFVSLPAARLIE